VAHRRTPRRRQCPGNGVDIAGDLAFDLSGRAASHLISTLLGVMLLLTAVALLFRHRLVAMGENRGAKFSLRSTVTLTVVTGAVLGVLVTISSVGAGAIGVTVLLLLYPKLPMARIVGSDIAHAVPLTLVAGIGHWFLDR